MEIGGFSGDPGLCHLFKRHSRLMQWLERPEEFWVALKRVLASLSEDVGDAGMHQNELGPFIFRQPTSNAKRIRFIAEASVLDVSEDSEDQFPLCIALSGIRELGQTDSHCREKLEAQVLGHAITMSL